ncbi:uncharacterized protein PHALS_12264 [Plasmopara halstedii]|uniref:Uncharacterized protein n=1 Tax=Plasmopara halstedii TaxID=4781 RepID=A0A0N7L5N3_PLAHL|nr:uncharacterized protein PHALS_12264 [Plasmopara halstedii]CEG41955.1 hypothetical protein PHALS_12264 [Plasmopara halstedii]|eukprot:XP_024578324.1 hypothetical protein PHALS_12264 [Plasmopara halstedii]
MHRQDGGLMRNAWQYEPTAMCCDCHPKKNDMILAAASYSCIVSSMSSTVTMLHKFNSTNKKNSRCRRTIEKRCTNQSLFVTNSFQKADRPALLVGIPSLSGYGRLHHARGACIYRKRYPCSSSFLVLRNDSS